MMTVLVGGITSGAVVMVLVSAPHQGSSCGYLVSEELYKESFLTKWFLFHGSVLCHPVNSLVDHRWGDPTQFTPFILDVVSIDFIVEIFLVDGGEFLSTEEDLEGFPWHGSWGCRRLPSDSAEHSFR